MNLQFLTTEPGQDPVILDATYDSSVDRLFRAWTEPEQLIKWFGREPNSLASVEIDLFVGGRVCFEFKSDQRKRSAIEGRYLRIEENRLLEFSWTHILESEEEGIVASGESTVTIQFEPLGDRTRLTLTHQGIVESGVREGVGTGWSQSLSRLMKVL